MNNQDTEPTAKRKPLPTAERVRELLDYNRESGQFVRRVARGPMKAGSVAGTNNDGYIMITMDGRQHAAHRMAWLYVHGDWPPDEIDHKNGNPSDNRIDNLRVASSLLNKQNKRRASSGKKYSPLLGAQWCKQARKWKASIRVDGRIKHLGFFKSDADASEAYIAAKRKFHEGCTL